MRIRFIRTFQQDEAILLSYRKELAESFIEVLLVGVVAREFEQERIQRARNGSASNLALQVILLDLRTGRSESVHTK